MIFKLFILSLVMTTPLTTRLQTSSVDQPLEDTKSPDIGKLLILIFHIITEIIHNFVFIIISGAHRLAKEGTTCIRITI